MCTGFCVQELNVYAKPIASALYRTFERVADVEVASDLFEINGVAFVGECGVSPMTNEPLMRDKSVVRLSVTPSTK
jgi:hypothetical protein